MSKNTSSSYKTISVFIPFYILREIDLSSLMILESDLIFSVEIKDGFANINTSGLLIFCYLYF